MFCKNGWMFAGLTLSLIGAGCEQQGGNFKTASQIKQEKGAAGHTDHEDHEHGAGPHGGSIVELGDEEYHAEVVVDAKSHALKVYLLGKDAKTPVPVAAMEVIVTTEDDKKLTLKAAPQEGDGEGKASLFELSDETTVDAIAKAGFIHGSLQLEAGGKPYRGDIDAHFDGASHEDHAEHKEGELKEEEHQDEPKPADAAPAASDAPAADAAPKDEASEK